MGWIILLWLGVIAIVSLLGFGAYLLYQEQKTNNVSRMKKYFLYVMIVIAIVVVIAGVLITGNLTKTESYKRFKKSMDSEFKGGITREITVYLENGDVIYNNEGKFDVQHNEERLKFVDENGKVQIIYLGRSSTAIVNEK